MVRAFWRLHSKRRKDGMKMEEKNELERLKEMLTDSEYRVKGECAVNLLLTKLDIVNIELNMETGRNVIQMRSGRIKSFESTCEKLRKKNLEITGAAALEHINDLIGTRAICSYVDDIYRVAEIIKNQNDVRVLKEKDYIRNPKKSGYQSLHLILSVPISFQGGNQWMKVELQLRTAAMDYWANLDHQLRYKRGEKEADLLGSELRECAETVKELDEKMLEMRKKIETI
jgi:putative GTP pyrophosphokinase